MVLCHIGSALVPHCFYVVDTLQPHCRSIVILLLRCCCHIVTMLFSCCRHSVPMLCPRSRHIVATFSPHCCHIVAKLLPNCCCVVAKLSLCNDKILGEFHKHCTLLIYQGKYLRSCSWRHDAQSTKKKATVSFHCTKLYKIQNKSNSVEMYT